MLWLLIATQNSFSYIVSKNERCYKKKHIKTNGLYYVKDSPLHFKRRIKTTQGSPQNVHILYHTEIFWKVSRYCVSKTRMFKV